MNIPKELNTIAPLSKYLAMVVFISLPFVGFFLGMRYEEKLDLAKRQEMEANLSIPRSPKPTPIEIPWVDPLITADWKTYTNTKYGFLFKYSNLWQPKNPDPNFPNALDELLTITKKNRSTIGSIEFDIRLSIERKKLGESLEDFAKPMCEENDHYCIPGPPDKQENVTINGIQALWQEKQYDVGGLYIKVFIPINNDVLIFLAPNSALDFYSNTGPGIEKAKKEGIQNVEYFKEILSTFHFSN